MKRTMKALRYPLGAFSFKALPPFRLQGFFIGKTKCRKDRNDHVPFRDARDSLTEGSARSMPKQKQDATRSTSEIPRQGNATARPGQSFVKPMLQSILSARSALRKEDIHRLRLSTTLNRYLRAELTTSATSKLYVKPVMPEFIAKWATDGAEK